MFILGITLWVFLLLVVLVCIITYAVENEKSFGAFVGILVAGILLHYTGTVNMLDILRNWQQLLMFIGAYIIVGTMWSVVKWMVFVDEWVKTQCKNLLVCRTQFLTAIQAETKEAFDFTEIPSKYAEWFELWSTGQSVYQKPKILTGCDFNMPRPAYIIESQDSLDVVTNLPRILVWCMYWPFSMIWTIIDEPVKKIAQFLIVNVLGGLFSSVSKQGVHTVEQKMKSMIKED